MVSGLPRGASVEWHVVARRPSAGHDETDVDTADEAEKGWFDNLSILVKALIKCSQPLFSALELNQLRLP